LTFSAVAEAGFMIKSNLLKPLFKNFMLAFAGSFLLTILLLQAFYHPDGSGYDGGIITIKRKLFYDIFISFLFTSCLAIASFTSFLNFYKPIRHRFLLRAISFFLFPSILVCSTFFMFFHPNDFLPFWAACVCFFIFQTRSFIRFNNFLKEKEIKSANR
jgi:hypothetical protein